MLIGRKNRSELRMNSDPGYAIAKLRQALGLDDLRAPHEAADRLADEHVALQIGRQPIGAHDVDARARP